MSNEKKEWNSIKTLAPYINREKEEVIEKIFKEQNNPSWSLWSFFKNYKCVTFNMCIS